MSNELPESVERALADLFAAHEAWQRAIRDWLMALDEDLETDVRLVRELYADGHVSAETYRENQRCALEVFRLGGAADEAKDAALLADLKLRKAMAS